MYIPGISPYILQLGPLHIRWYGLFMALSMAIGIAYLVREGRRLGYDEDFLTNWGLVAVVGGVVGARLVFVLTNPVFFLHHLGEVASVWLGGLSIHGGLLGGLLAAWAYARRKGMALAPILDLSVVGIAVGIALVRVGNIFNQEILGYPAGILGGARHPVQLYESAIGVFLLVQYLRHKGRDLPAGYLFWNAVFWYSMFRGVTEFFRVQNPHYLISFTDPYLGIGGITLTQWFTPAILAFTYLMRRRSLRLGAPSAAAAPSHPAANSGMAVAAGHTGKDPA